MVVILAAKTTIKFVGKAIASIWEGRASAVATKTDSASTAVSQLTGVRVVLRVFEYIGVGLAVVYSLSIFRRIGI